MAKGKNPIKYSEIFDLSNKSVVNQIVKDLQKIDSEYNKLADSIDKQSKVMRDSFVRTAEQMIAASQRLNVSRHQDRDAIRELAVATDELRNRQRAQAKNEEEGAKAKKFAADSVKGLKSEINNLIKEYQGLSKSETAQAARMKDIIKRVQELKAEEKALSDQLKITTKTVDAATGSYKALEIETAKLTKDLKAMPNAFDASNKEAQKLIKQINENNTRLKEFDKNLNIHTRNVGNYPKSMGGAVQGLKGFALAMAATYIGFESFQQLAEKAIKTNVEISDSLADVRRTAELTAKEGDALVDSLKELDTRTSLKGLVDLATIGGQLGVPKAELTGFVSAIDQLAVSLKGELSGGAEEMAKALGKVNAVFQVSRKEGVDTEGAMLKTGSAILKLGQAGLATGDYLADFAQRTGGVAASAGIALPKVLAYGATLEEMGVSAEVAGTTMSQLITVLAKSPEAFFKVAKLGDATLTIKEFTNTINTDTSKALDQFFKGLQTGGADLTTFSKMISGLGLDGTRATGVISALAKNTSILETRTKQATEAFQAGTLASEQFQLKNTNLAAALEKLGNVITNALVNSRFSAALATFINGLVSGQTEADKLTASFVEQKAAMDKIDSTIPGLLSEYDRLTAKSKELGGVDKLTAEEQEKLNDTLNQIGDIMPDVITEVDKYGNVVSIARDKVAGLTDAMRENMKLANRDAAKQIRDEVAQREYLISVLQKQIETGQKLVSKGGPAGELGYEAIDRNAARQEVAKYALQNAEAIKKLRETLVQDLSPAEQAVFDKFYKNQKRTSSAADEAAKKAAELAAAQKKADEAAAKAGVSLDDFGKKGKRAKTEIEQLEEQVRLLEDAVGAQALKGKVNKETLDQLVTASGKLRTAQETTERAVRAALDPYQALQGEVSRLTDQLQRQTARGQDTTKTVEQLTEANARLQEVQDEVKLSISGTVGVQERLNTQLELSRKELEKQAATGNITNKTLNDFSKLTIQVRDNSESLQLAILSITDPMAALNLQAEQLKRTLTEQAVAGDLSTEELEKYRVVLQKIADANARLAAATNFNPLDPAGRIQAADLELEQNQRGLNAVSVRADGGDRAAIARQRELEQERLAITMRRLDAEQAQYKAGSMEWERIETEKTKILSDQERLRTQTAQDEMNKRVELASSGLSLLSEGLSGWYNLQKERGDAEISRLEDAKDRELELAGNNAAQRAMIEEKYAQKQREIKRRQAQQEKTNALFQIAIETAIGSAKAIASSPLTFGMPWLAFVLAQGALNAALVAARPIPAFAKGTKNAPAGVVMVGEKGQEAIQHRDGSVSLTGHSAHYAVMQGGEIIHTADSAETKMYQRMLQERDSVTASGKMYVDAAGRIMHAKEEYDARVTAAAIDKLADKTDRQTAAINEGNRMLAQELRKNRPTKQNTPNWFKLNDRADYINKSMFK